MSRKIIGVTVGSPLPKPNLMQTDPSKGDYVKGKEEFIEQFGGSGGTGADGFSPTAKVMTTVGIGKNTATITITDKNGTTSATISDGTPGRSIYIYDSSVSKDSYGQYPDTAVTVPDGCTLNKGDLLIDSDGNIYSVTSKGSSTFNRTLVFTISGESGGNVAFDIDETLTLTDGVLSVNTTNDMEQDNTLPITSAGVFATVGNIEALLKTI